jgi:flagellar basal body-associated protein FliL
MDNTLQNPPETKKDTQRTLMVWLVILVLVVAVAGTLFALNNKNTTDKQANTQASAGPQSGQVTLNIQPPETNKGTGQVTLEIRR